jgi:hypothetical protein
MATLAVADKADGTGATATVTGSAGGANQVYVQNVDGQLGAFAWTLGGTRTGDGTVNLALAKGYYWAYCLTGGTVISNLAYFQVTDGADAVLSRVYAAAKALLQLLNLPFTQRVYPSQFADSVAVQVPCTVLTTDGARQTDEAALNGRDDVGQPVRALVKDVCLKFDDQKKAEYEKWRQSIFRAFHNQRLPGVAESKMNKVELGVLSPAESPAPQTVFEVTIRCVTREVRGLGA